MGPLDDPGASARTASANCIRRSTLSRPCQDRGSRPRRETVAEVRAAGSSPSSVIASASIGLGVAGLTGRRKAAPTTRSHGLEAIRTRGMKARLRLQGSIEPRRSSTGRSSSASPSPDDRCRPAEALISIVSPRQGSPRPRSRPRSHFGWSWSRSRPPRQGLDQLAEMSPSATDDVAASSRRRRHCSTTPAPRRG